jgi:hypothetical protein
MDRQERAFALVVPFSGILLAAGAQKPQARPQAADQGPAAALSLENKCRKLTQWTSRLFGKLSKSSVELTPTSVKEAASQERTLGRSIFW